MVAKLRAKPGGAAIPVTIGDFAAFQADGTFNLIFVVFNTFFGLVTQEAQVQCFRHVAAHLRPGGVFLIEAFVPDPGRFTRGQSVGVTRIDPDLVSLDVARHDPLAQRVDSQHLVFTESGTRLYPVQLRYAWPSELDRFLPVYEGSCPQIGSIGQSSAILVRDPIVRRSAHHYSSSQVLGPDFGGLKLPRR